MMEKVLLFIQLIIIVFGGVSATCDMVSAVVPEGLLGQTTDFMWLGVLQVHIQDFDKRHVAMSGIVVIKPKYALANADDVARIPERVFKQDTVAVFIRATNTPYALSVLSYTVHPEYEDSTVHSLAIVELDIGNTEDFQLIPICLPMRYNKVKTLYLTGYTDENKALEKVIYQIQTLNNQVCDEYYERAGFSDKSSIPSASVCGYAPYSSIKCSWDDGMALVSNSTGVFTLIGLSIRGPGCTAPARYIELYPYISWIQLVTGPKMGSVATPPPQTQRRDQFDYVPVYKLFTSNETRRKGVKFTVIGHEFLPNIKDDERSLDHYNITPIENDSKTIAIFPIKDNMYEGHINACKKMRMLMYREEFHLKAIEETGQVTYKLSLYNLKNMICVCVTLNVQCTERTAATLSFREELDFVSGTEDLQTIDFGMTKYAPNPVRTAKPNNTSTSVPKSKDKMRFTPNVLTWDTVKASVLTNELYIKFKFSGAATLRFKLFASVTRPATSTEPSTTTKDGRRYPKVREEEHLLWGMPDMLYKDDSDTLVADVQETVSVGSRSAPTLVIVALASVLIALVYNVCRK